MRIEELQRHWKNFPRTAARPKWEKIYNSSASELDNEGNIILLGLLKIRKFRLRASKSRDITVPLRSSSLTHVTLNSMA